MMMKVATMASQSRRIAVLGSMVLLMNLGGCTGRSAMSSGDLTPRTDPSPAVVLPSDPSPTVSDTSPASTPLESSPTPLSAAPTPIAPTPTLTSPSPNPKSLSSQPSTEPSIVPSEAPYCFQFQDKNLTATAQLTIGTDQQVTGNVQGTIHNEEMGYYSSYQQSLDGVLAGTQLTLHITTQIELDKQQSQETWTITPTRLDTGREVYDRTDCSELK